MKISEKKNETSNTGLHIIKIYCSLCGSNSPCKNTEECFINNKIDFDIILSNDKSHLAVLND